MYMFSSVEVKAAGFIKASRPEERDAPFVPEAALPASWKTLK